MSVKLTNTYSDVQVEDVNLVVFPPEVHGSIKPGSLDHLTKAICIEWGTNMTGLIEPGTIPPCCITLLLPSSYKHPITDRLGTNVTEYVHHSNIETVKHDRPFHVWKRPSEPNPSTPKTYDCSCSWSRSQYFKGTSFIISKRLPVAVPSKPVSPPVPQACMLDNLDALLTLSKSQESNSHILFAKRIANRIIEEMTEAAVDGYLHTNFSYELNCPTPLQPTIMALQELLGPKLTVSPDQDSDRPGIIVTLKKD